MSTIGAKFNIGIKFIKQKIMGINIINLEKFY